MGSISKWISNTPKAYQFTIESSLGNLVCDKEPLEWKEGIRQINREMECAGLFNAYQIDSLTFVGNAADRLRALFLASEVNAEADLVVEKLDRSTMEYVQFPDKYRLVFADYKITKIGDMAIGVNLKCTRSGLNQKFKDRKGNEVDLKKLISVGGVTIEDHIAAIDKPFKLLAIDNYISAYWYSYIYGGVNQYDVLSHATDVTYSSIPLNTELPDFPEAKNTPFSTLQTSPIAIPYFFENSSVGRTLNVRPAINVFVHENESTDVYTYAIEHRSGSTLIEKRVLDTFGSTEGRVYLGTTAQSFTLSAGDSLRVYIETAGNASSELEIEIRQFSVHEGSVSTTEKIIQGVPILETIERCLQLILDINYPLYSEYFGRVDVKHNATECYLTENSARFAHLFSGLNIRGVPLDSSIDSFVVKFDELFESLDSMWSLGYGIENGKIRIEDYAYFFQNSEIIDLSSRIYPLDISTEYMPQYAYSEIVNGYENFDYDSINGRGEYNTKVTHSTFLNTPQKLEMVSKIRADVMGIAKQAEQIPNVEGSEDKPGDSHLFIIKSQRLDETDSDWVAEQQELITQEDDSSMFGDSSLNLYLTPIRNLVRNKNKFLGAMQKNSAGLIQHQKSHKYQNLRTDGEGFMLRENETLTTFFLNSLGWPLWKPIKHTVECVLTDDEFDTILQNQYGFITFTKSISGFILSVSKKNCENKATIEIIERFVYAD